jgi:hypothetical protein
MGNKFKRVSVVLAVFVVLGLGILAFRSNPVDEIIDGVRDFTEAELSKPGSTAKDPTTGEEVFVGVSATRVAEVHEQAAREIDALRARNPEEREKALAAIRKFAGENELAIEYGATVPNPNAGGQMAELYSANGVQYWVDPRDDTVRFMLLVKPFIPSKDTKSIEYSIQQSEAQARDFLEKYCICFKKTEKELKFQLAEKNIEGGPSIRFFRWGRISENNNEAESLYDVPPFIQVGISSDGTIVSYTDTICSGQHDSQEQ